LSASSQNGLLDSGTTTTLPIWKRGYVVVSVFGLAGLLMSVIVASIGEHYPQMSPASIVWVLFLSIPVTIGSVIGVVQGARKLSALYRKTVWWHWMWLLIACSSLVFRFARDTSEVTAAPIDSWAMLRLGPEAIVFIVLIMRLVMRKPNWLPELFTGLPKWMAIFALICTATTMWSVYAAWTFYKSVEFLFDVSLLAAIIASVQSIDGYSTLLDWTWLLYGAELLSAWLSAVVWPADAFVNGRLEGVFPIVPYNAVGETGSLLALIAFCRLFLADQKKNRSWYAVLLVFGLVSLFFSQTRKVMAGLLLAIVLVLYYKRRLLKASLLTIGGVLSVLFVRTLMSATSGGSVDYIYAPFVKIGDATWSYLQRDQTTEQMMSLTGRMDWWRFAWDQFVHHPFSGLGAYAAGKFVVLAQLHLNNGAIHSDFMEIIVGTGIWGLFPVLLALVATWWFLIRGVRSPVLSPYQRQLALEGIGVLAILTVHSVFNVELIWHAPLLFFAVLGYAEMIRRRLQTADKPAYLPGWSVSGQAEPTPATW
jgi:O-antigen ligase